VNRAPDAGGLTGAPGVAVVEPVLVGVTWDLAAGGVEPVKHGSVRGPRGTTRAGSSASARRRSKARARDMASSRVAGFCRSTSMPIWGEGRWIRSRSVSSR
jgi:hypothetical protein